MNKAEFNDLKDKLGPTEGHTVTMILSYDYKQLRCNESLLCIMLDSFLHGTEQIIDVIDTIIEDELDTIERQLTSSNNFNEGILSEENLLQSVETKKHMLYNDLVDMVDREYRELELAALPAMQYIANGYYLSAAAPLGTDVIITLDSGE